MRKFLLALSLSMFSLLAAADEASAVAGLRAFKAPMAAIVREAAKGPDADFDVVAKDYAAAGEAWKKVVAEPLDLDRHGVPTAKQEEVWRQVRLMGMLMGYLDEATKRHDRALMLRAAGMLESAYAPLATALGLPGK